MSDKGLTFEQYERLQKRLTGICQTLNKLERAHPVIHGSNIEAASTAIAVSAAKASGAVADLERTLGAAKWAYHPEEAHRGVTK